MKMKNKKAEQADARKRHKELIAAKKKSTTVLTRKQPSLNVKKMILIVCEGKNTEYSYFKKFRVSTAKVETIGEGYNTVSLVERALELSRKENYDEIWCVFDADPKPDNPQQLSNFNLAIAKADKYGFKVAYSNQAFEYWLILHFDDHQGGSMDRKLYNEVINKHLSPFGIEYDGEGSKWISDEFFAILDGIDEKTGKERKTLAKNRAERNCNSFDDTNIATHESSTTVYKLVDELLEHC